MLTWRKGNLRGGAREIDEVERSIGFLIEHGNIGLDGSIDELLVYAESQYRRAPMVTLDDVNWRKMANTGSYWDYNYAEVKTFKQLFSNLQLDQEKRDISRVVKQFMGDGEINDFSGRVECPICFKLNKSGGVMQDGRFMGPYYLIGGNTRLTVAKVLGLTPRIISINVDW